MNLRILSALVLISAASGLPLILVALANTLRWEGLANPLFWLTIFGAYGMAHALVGLHLPARKSGASA